MKQGPGQQLLDAMAKQQQQWRRQQEQAHWYLKHRQKEPQPASDMQTSMPPQPRKGHPFKAVILGLVAILLVVMAGLLLVTVTPANARFAALAVACLIWAIGLYRTLRWVRRTWSGY